MLIRIIPLGNIQTKFLEFISADLEETLKVRTRIMQKMSIPSDAYNNFRRQYNAERILDVITQQLEAKFIDKSIVTLFLTEEDIYYGGLNFVFGLEDTTKSSFIVSLARLKPEFYDQRPNIDRVVERTSKEIVHEIGHGLNLEHCHNRWCVMSFSPSVDDVDIKKKTFCDDCKIKMMTRGISLE